MHSACIKHQKNIHPLGHIIQASYKHTVTLEVWVHWDINSNNIMEHSIIKRSYLDRTNIKVHSPVAEFC